MRGNSSNETKMAAKLSKEEAEEYFTRINYTGSKERTVEVLTELHRCHILSVPFENLSVYGKEKIELSKEWLFEKIVRRHRGGFCFELNTMFSFLLDYLGFEYTTHAASVLDRKTGVLGPPVEHRLLMVKVGGELLLTDVGFGDSFWLPLRFTGLQEHQEQQSGTYRIRKSGDDHIYEEKIKIIVDETGQEEIEKEQITSPEDPMWVPRYIFDLIPRKTEDFFEMLEYHQTNDKSPFTHDRICTMAKPWGRVTLSGHKIVITRFLGDNKVKKESRNVEGGEHEVVKELEEAFGIRKDSCFYPEG